MENTQIIRAALKAEGITECGFLPTRPFPRAQRAADAALRRLQSAVVFLIPTAATPPPRTG